MKHPASPQGMSCGVELARETPSRTPAVDPRASSAIDPPARLWFWAGTLWLLLVGLMLLANPGTTGFVHQHWQTDAYGHSWLVVGVAVWLVWRLRTPLLAEAPTPSLWGLLVLAGIAVFWWFGYVLEIRALGQMALMAAITGITWTLLGTRVTALLAFPLLYLFLTVSAWDVLIRPLQEATAWLSEPTVRALGVPLYRDGPYLWIPEGRFLVDETCAGLRYFLVALSLGTLYAYLSFADLWRRVLFIALTIVWAGLLLNVIRVAAVVYVGHVTAMQHPWVHDHGDMGWVLFGLGLLPLFLAGALMHRLRPAQWPVLRLGPSIGRDSSQFQGRRGLMAAGLAAALLIVSAPLGAHALEARAIAGSADSRPPDLPQVSGWVGPDDPPDHWLPHFPAADAEHRAVYRAGPASVYLYQAWYAYERDDAKLMYFGNRLFERRQWRLLSDRPRHLDLNGVTWTVREQVLRDPGQSHLRVLWSWYRVDDAATANAMQAKLFNLRGVLRGRPEAMVVALAADAATEELARADLQTYLTAASDLWP